ncbi:hypothetical protein FIU82_07805 [Pseudoalteromonas sp. THAF3]|uniref:zinc ribbon domain-containing protein n=1 Tax=Pseudoalteromonas TaxID=53246 RepID=UPI00110A290B|nr:MULTISPECIES: zinc ribbon domain-containing protein [Pseudoalteromonas]QFU04918.1 hypothetical protein FIU82_07805 [Pseudoalteromonas sp. THAF3]TMO47212.1 hypothetical protein CWC24_08005 [Pseudoalteromonas ruthenica]TMO51385.1 hypothetical protein CWC23_07520 [Pseudoalteromonas ruthenica]
MFDNEPNYSSYSLDELFDAYSSIDKDSFPERFNLIKKIIAEKQGGDYQCPKCKCKGYEAGQLYAAADRLESILDYETGKYVTISCLDCGFTELYKRNSTVSAPLVDFFTT